MKRLLANIQTSRSSDIAADKLYAILTEKNAKSFMDFYLIQKSKSYDLDFLLERVKQKYDLSFDPLYLASRLLMVEDFTNYPKMVKKFSRQDMIGYFISLAKEQKEKIVF